MAKAEEALDMALDDVIQSDRGGGRKGGGKGKGKGGAGGAVAKEGEAKGQVKERKAEWKEKADAKTKAAAGAAEEGGTEGKLDMSLDDVIEANSGGKKARKGKGKGKDEKAEPIAVSWKPAATADDKKKNWETSWSGKSSGSGPSWGGKSVEVWGESKTAAWGDQSSWGGSKGSDKKEWYANTKNTSGGDAGKWSGGGSGGKSWPSSAPKDDWKDPKASWGASKPSESWSAKAKSADKNGSWPEWKDGDKDKGKSWSGSRGMGDRDSGKNWGGAGSKHWDSSRDDRSGASRGTKRSYEESASGRRPSVSKRINVSNIPRTLDWRDLKDAFEKEAGTIERCELRMGEAMITFHREQDAKRAVETFDRGELNGRTIGVELVQ